jgi:competence protein CoiA
MEFALVDGQRHRAEPKLEGTCPLCSKKMISKCGTKVVWHWAHLGRKHCDLWWENETEWHRSWKECFPTDWHEKIHFDSNGEKHVADVKTPAGTVLEFQNSAMSPDELQAREQFYGNMVWVVNGRPFIDHFFILGRLPSHEACWTRDIVFFPQRHDIHGRCFWRKSENPGHIPGDLVLMHGVNEIQDEIDNDYCGHHSYSWVRPRSVWFGAKSSVYIDFGGDLLWHLRHYSDDLQCVQAIRKKTLMAKLGGEFIETGEIIRAAKRPRRSGDPISSGQDDIIPHQIQ